MKTTVSIYTHSFFVLRTKGSSESAILIFRWVLAFADSGVNKVIDDFGADIISEFTRKKQWHVCQVVVPCQVYILFNFLLK